MAEEMGIISRITHFVLERASRDCAGWEQPAAVSVNLSVHDLMMPDFVGDVLRILARNGLPPTRLHVELTESCFIDDPVAVSDILYQLREEGVTIAIDDFGTGFSSLSYLSALPLDIVKVDRAFIRDINHNPRQTKLLRGITLLSRDLGLQIVMEGVETQEQLMLISDNRFADLIQGYVFAPPVDADTAAGMLRIGSQPQALKASRKRLKPVK